MSIYAESANNNTAGLALVPLYPFSDLPSVNFYARYSAQPVSKEQSAEWERKKPSYNVGCVAGESSGVIFVQVFDGRERTKGIIEELLPETPWVMTEDDKTTYAYKYRQGLESFSLELLTHNIPILKLKGAGDLQIVPPSIPQRGQAPLVATGPLDPKFLPELTPQFEEIVRGSLLSEGIKLRPSGHSGITEHTPEGEKLYRLRRGAVRMVTDTLSGLRTLQESFDILTSMADELEASREQLDEIYADYLQFLREDMTLLGKSLAGTWNFGLNPPIPVPFGPEDVEMGYSELKTFVYTRITETFHDDEKRLEAVQETLKHMNQAPTLDEVQEDLLVRYIAKQANLGLTVATLRRRLKSLNTGTCPGENQTEIAEALHRQLTRVCPHAYYKDQFWRFTGASWEAVKTSELANLISGVFGHLPAARRASDHFGILKILQGKLPDYIHHPMYQLHSGVNFSNGYLTDKLELVPHAPELGAQYVMPFPYEPDKSGAEHRPMFEKFLADCWGEDDDFEEKVQVLREALAVTLFGIAYKYQRVFLLFGVPKSGKSQLLNIISSLVPTAARTSLPPTEWGERFCSAELHGKIMNVAGELSETRLIDGHLFKDIVDGTEQLGEHKGTNFFKFIPKCAHWFASNHFPKTRDTSEGFIRRWKILVFKRSVPDGATLIRDLGNLIAAREKDAIVAWAIEALPSLTQRGEFTIPRSHMEALGDVANQNNSVRFFMTGSGLLTVANPSLKGQVAKLSPEQLKQLPYLTGDVLHVAYSNFLSVEGGVRPVSSQRFHQMMLELCDQMGLAQKQVRFRNGRTMYVYYNLELVTRAVGTEPTENEPFAAQNNLTMDKLLGISQTDSDSGSIEPAKNPAST